MFFASAHVSGCVTAAFVAIAAGTSLGQTSFDMYNALFFTGMPQSTPPSPFTANAYAASGSPFQSGTWTPNDGAIQYAIQQATATGAHAIVWDVEQLQALSYPVGGDPGLDAGLDGLRSLFTRTHELAGAWNLKVGMYIANVPGDYWAPRYFESVPPDYQSYLDWLGRYKRLNQRADGSVVPFRGCCDFVVVEAYPRKTGCAGTAAETEAIREFSEILSGNSVSGTPFTYGVLDAARFLASANPLQNCSPTQIAPPDVQCNDIPIIPWTTPHVVEGDGPWCGRALSCAYMSAILNAAHTKAQGLGVWGGDHVSSYYNYQEWTGVISDLTNCWQRIDNGALDVLYGGEYFALRNMNFTKVHSMNEVAAVIASALHGAVVASHNDTCNLSNLPDAITMTFNPNDQSLVISVDPQGPFGVVNPPDARPGPSSCYPSNPTNLGIGVTNILGYVGTRQWNSLFFGPQSMSEWTNGWGYSGGQPVGWMKALLGQTCSGLGD